MKKLYITLGLALISFVSLGSDGDTLTKNYKKIVKNKDTSLIVTYTISVTDTIPRNNYNKEIARYEEALKASEANVKFYMSEIKRLKAEKKKTD